MLCIAERSTCASISDPEIRMRYENPNNQATHEVFHRWRAAIALTTLSYSTTSSEWDSLRSPHIVVTSETPCPSGAFRSSQSGANGWRLFVMDKHSLRLFIAVFLLKIQNALNA